MIELRSISGAHCTIEKRAAGLHVEGCFPYGVEANIAGSKELFLPTAFRNSIEGKNTIFLLHEHDIKKRLAHTGNNTLRLVDNDNELLFDADIVNTELRAEGAGISVGFTALRSYSYQGVRVIREADLLELSVVQNPAYPDTKIATRSGAPKFL